MVGVPGFEAPQTGALGAEVLLLLLLFELSVGVGVDSGLPLGVGDDSFELQVKFEF